MTSELPDDLLERRTEQLARRIDHAVVVAEPLLILRIGGDRYGLAPVAVRAVTELRKITPLPHVPPRVLGLTSRGGSVIPVFELRAVLGLPLTTLPEYGRIVICGEDCDEIALAVEAVEQSTAVSADDITPLPPSASATLRGFARGVAPGSVVVLDHAALLASELLFVDAPIPR
jgi:purine-binding chemotaxis protein CheW